MSEGPPVLDIVKPPEINKGIFTPETTHNFLAGVEQVKQGEFVYIPQFMDAQNVASIRQELLTKFFGLSNEKERPPRSMTGHIPEDHLFTYPNVEKLLSEDGAFNDLLRNAGYSDHRFRDIGLRYWIDRGVALHTDHTEDTKMLLGPVNVGLSLAGEADFTARTAQGDKTVLLKPGDLYLFPTGMKHEVSAPHGNGTRLAITASDITTQKHDFANGM